MTKIAILSIVLICMMLWTMRANAQTSPFAWGINIQQIDEFGTGYINRGMPVPAGGKDGILMYDAASNLPALGVVDSTLEWHAGQELGLSAAKNAEIASKMPTPSGSVSEYMRGNGTLATFPSIPAAQVNSDWSASSGVSQVLNKPTSLSGYGITDAYPLNGNPSNFLTAITNSQITSALGYTPYNSTNPNGYVSQAGARSAISLTTTGSGAATYNSSTGVLNVPPPATFTPFNFSQPTARTLAASTSYQATDTTKPAVIYPSYACQNATQVLASSACTLQVRMGASPLTCSTGTVYYTQSLSVNLGVLLTQNSTNPVPIFLPTGAHFIMCPTAGTFTVTAVEQVAN